MARATRTTARTGWTAEERRQVEKLRTEGRLMAPEGGARVRMYRIGHGDCFLIAFAGTEAMNPAYVLIDCGYKPGSTVMARRDWEDGAPSEPSVFRPDAEQPKVKDIAKDIQLATGDGKVDLAIITHEHQDHVNGITKGHFGEAGSGLKIGELWLAWTEKPGDPDAEALRQEHGDRLLGLIAARRRLGLLAEAASRLGLATDRQKAQAKKKLGFIDELLAFEFGGDDETPFDFKAMPAVPPGMLGAAGGAGSMNKASMKLFKDKADTIRFLSPHEGIVPVPGAASARAFPLGPPRDRDLLGSMNPDQDLGEDFHLRFAAEARRAGFLAAALGTDAPLAAAAGLGEVPEGSASPFGARHRVPLSQATSDEATREFMLAHYGEAINANASSADAVVQAVPSQRAANDPMRGAKEVADDAAFRRIDEDWLGASGPLALAMNDFTNNTSLVIAFELTPGGKVLLFVGDAQRGNWLSWDDKSFADDSQRAEGRPRTVTTRDLLGRTVLYKAGHHGSHNATLNAREGDEKANLNWIGQGDHSREFTAMITAVRAWAETQDGWDHPLPAIKKASGRVFQTDTDLEQMPKPDRVSEQEWRAFKERCDSDGRLYFDLRIDP